MNTLLTGFGPFRDVVSNPTERLVRHFAEGGHPGHTFSTLVMPVSYRGAGSVLAEAIDHGEKNGRPFDLVWMLGVSGRHRRWRVERFGRNLNGTLPDAEAFVPEPVIDPLGPEQLRVGVPAGALVAALLEAGVAAQGSLSAGAYLCNHALYLALRRVQTGSCGARVGFLHVPIDDETLAPGASRRRPVTFDRQVHAVEVTLTTLAQLGRAG